jgi:hypothetical protein
MKHLTNVSTIILLLLMMILPAALYAAPPEEGLAFYLDAGAAVSGSSTDGTAFGIALDPSIALSPAFSMGSKNILSYSAEGVIVLETQAYLRWNFLHTFMEAPPQVKPFVQAGFGLYGALTGPEGSRTSRRQDSRSSLLFDGTAGVTIPLSNRWHIEPSLRAGFPFIWGAAVTVGYKIPARLADTGVIVTEYVEVPIETIVEVEVPVEIEIPVEVIRRELIARIDYIVFAPNAAVYNAGLNSSLQALNDIVLNSVANILLENISYTVKIAGHANPVNNSARELQTLSVLSERRANAVAAQLMSLNVPPEQISATSYGGAHIINTERNRWAINRRVELRISIMPDN